MPSTIYTVAIAARMSSGSEAEEDWNAAAVPAKLPVMVSGTLILAMVFSMAAAAVPSATPCGSEKEMVAATRPLWWFTAIGVVPGSIVARVESGTMVSLLVLTAAP